MSNEKLLPCPFCGMYEAREVIQEGYVTYTKFIQCKGCGAKGPEYPDGTSLHILWWNTRTEPK